ncbi:MAG: HPF/RaiA family ribosome-associated protein [Betaproteobacteria bacterium]
MTASIAAAKTAAIEPSLTLVIFAPSWRLLRLSRSCRSGHAVRTSEVSPAVAPASIARVAHPERYRPRELMLHPAPRVNAPIIVTSLHRQRRMFNLRPTLPFRLLRPPTSFASVSRACIPGISDTAHRPHRGRGALSNSPARRRTLWVARVATTSLPSLRKANRMQIQINTDHNIEGREALAAHVQGIVEGAMKRLTEHITRLEVHLSDENADKSNLHDKRCMIEARVQGRPPIAVTDHAATIHQAVEGAAEKLTRAIESALGRAARSVHGGGRAAASASGEGEIDP